MFGEMKNFSAFLCNVLSSREVITLFGCYPVMYYGNCDSPDGEPTGFDYYIYHPSVINTWVAQVSDYLSRETDSAKNINTMNPLVGRRKSFLDTMRRMSVSAEKN